MIDHIYVVGDMFSYMKERRAEMQKEQERKRAFDKKMRVRSTPVKPFFTEQNDGWKLVSKRRTKR